MKSEEAVQVGHCTARNIDGWPHRVISRFAMWNHDVQTIGGAALENDDQPLFLVSQRFGAESGPSEEPRNRGGAHDRHCAITKKNATGDGHNSSGYLF